MSLSRQRRPVQRRLVQTQARANAGPCKRRRAQTQVRCCGRPWRMRDRRGRSRTPVRSLPQGRARPDIERDYVALSECGNRTAHRIAFFFLGFNKPQPRAGASPRTPATHGAKELSAREWLSRSPSRPMHRGWLRCSSVTYPQYAPSSRLASRAPRPRSSIALVAMYRGWLRCSSVTYPQYAPSSRLASRAPRPRSSTDLAIRGPLAALNSKDRGRDLAQPSGHVSRSSRALALTRAGCRRLLLLERDFGQRRASASQIDGYGSRTWTGCVAPDDHACAHI